jgi:DNA anti-recombination protein RmuC
MRIQTLATITLAVGLVPVTHSSALAQFAGQSTPSEFPQSGALRSVVANQQTPAFAPYSNRSSANALAGAAQSDQIVGEIRSMEQGLEQANRLLQQRLARADQIRRQGLQQQDQRLLQQAEQMDRQAMAAYEQQLRQFESFSQRLQQTSQARAEQTAARANGILARPNPAVRDNVARPPSNTAPLRGLFRFGR